MNLLVRTLLIWLLVLAIPAPGFAAGTMAFCGPRHQGDTAAAAAEPATAGHAHDGPATMVAHAHERADAGAAAADAPGVPAQAKGVATDAHQCNVCGACCSTAALMGAVPALPATQAAATGFAAIAASVDAFAADGPDRPPRNLLA